MPRHEGEALLSVAQAAALLGVHPNTIRAWTDAGRLAAYRINARGDRRFRRDDVARLLVEDGTPVPAVERPGELAALGRIAAAFAAAPTAPAVARATVEILRTAFRASRVAVYLAEPGRLELSAHAGFRTAPPGTWPSPDDEDTSDDDGLRTIELATRRRTAGLLVIDESTASALSAPFVDALTATLSSVIVSARLLSRARREIDRARALRGVTKELAGELDLTTVLDDIVDRTRTLFEADRAGVWLLDETEHPRALVTRGLSHAFLARGASLSVESDAISIRAVQERRARWTRNAGAEPAVGEMRDAYAAEGINTVCVVPLLVHGRATGILGLYHDEDRMWPEEELALVQAFADQAAVAIQNARLYRSVADQSARMRSIQDLSARLNRLTDVRAIAEAIVAEARTLADYHDIRVYRVDRERGTCDPIAFTREMLDGDPADAEDLLRVAIGEGFTGWVAEHGEPLLINNAVDDPRGKTIEGTDDVPESMLVVPMLYEGRALGVIVLSQLGVDRFTNDDLQTMGIFAGYAAQAMANADTYETLVAQSTELARRVDSQRRLLKINEQLLSTLDQADVLETIADGLRDVVHYDNLSIYRADDTRQQMLPVLTREMHAEEVRRYAIPYGLGLMGWSVEHAEPILANDALNDPRALQIPGTPPDPEAVAVVPLIAEGEVLGALNVSRLGSADEVGFSSSDFELILLFAAQASIALRNADRHHAVRQLADTDALTGLANHGAFQRDLGELLDAPGADDAPASFTVLMTDLDQFKAYNDRHGHPAGDALLHTIATTIYGAVRSDDRVYRYGGDEFALILPRASRSAAAEIGERIRAAVASLTASDPSPVTITVGVAVMPDDALDRASLLAAADTALYYGKRSGENRVVRTDELPSDIDELRGTLEELASAALRDGDDERAVEHFVERASLLTGTHHDDADSLRDAVLATTRSLQMGRVRGDRVARLAISVAETLGRPDGERKTIELAARLHAINDQQLAELGSVPALRESATLIAGHRALLADGVRRGRRGARPRGRLGSHIIGVAIAYDQQVAGSGTSRPGRREAIEALHHHPATFRRVVVDAMATAVGQQRDAGHRRRRVDRSHREERGAA
jgi:diguanylate cyclase (GGDEF)-like protein/excisionase family DNA binding protein